MPVDKVREILKIAQEPVSLETPIGEEEDSHLGDFIPDEDCLLYTSLSPSQQRVLSEELGVAVMDRSALILDIFAQRARTCLLYTSHWLTACIPRRAWGSTGQPASPAIR